MNFLQLSNAPAICDKVVAVKESQEFSVQYAKNEFEGNVGAVVEKKVQ